MNFVSFEPVGLEDSRIIADCTQSLDIIIKYVTANRLALIRGCPMTGKTSLALCALRFAKQQTATFAGKEVVYFDSHCLLHGKLNVEYRCGDLSDQAAIAGEFGLIDSFGVLHHLEDPLAGLKALERRIVPGGILRIMLYSRYARREEESIRRAFRLLGIETPRAARRLFKKARAGSRLAGYLAAADETATDAGIADALLHPRARTYRIDELLEMISQAGLRPLLFAHPGALEDVAEEIDRLRALDKMQRSPGNYVLYLGRNNETTLGKAADSMIMLNPCLTASVSLFKLGTLRIPARTGCCNPPLGFRARSFLRAFTSPVPGSSITGEEAELVAMYKRALFLLEYSP
jgi:SAM-dependent methyltransferase